LEPFTVGMNYSSAPGFTFGGGAAQARQQTNQPFGNNVPPLLLPVVVVDYSDSDKPRPLILILQRKEVIKMNRSKDLMSALGVIDEGINTND